MFRYNCDKESSRYNLIGKVDASNGETYFKDGVLPKAMERPSVFLIDEADAALGDITMALQPVLEGNPLLIGERRWSYRDAAPCFSDYGDCEHVRIRAIVRVCTQQV